MPRARARMTSSTSRDSRFNTRLVNMDALLGACYLKCNHETCQTNIVAVSKVPVKMPITDEEAALQAIATLEPLSAVQLEADQKIKTILATEDPFPDIHDLFPFYDILYFRSILKNRVEFSWSSRLTLCAGICELVRDPANKNRFTRIRLKLSEPLLKFRPRSDVLSTLLHEMIHAYFFVTTSWRHSRGDDGTGHGAGFLLLADAISSHNAAYRITVFHTFHDEVDSYRTHVWRCEGPCTTQPPFFGLVKRSMNRAPGKGDSWWQKHQEECGGSFSKISNPGPTKEQLERLGALKRAGFQKNKLDSWINGLSRKRRRSSADDEIRETAYESHREVSTDHGHSQSHMTTTAIVVKCPICSEDVAQGDINAHIDTNHPL
nr:isoform 2 of sprt-like domain-containing protein spartan [Quercus suber]